MEITLADSAKLLTAVIAMLNSQSGRVWLLLPPGTASFRTARDTIDSLCRRILPDPGPCLEARPEERDGESYIRLEVRQGMARPYFAGDEGLEKGVWLLERCSVRRATRAQTLALIVATDGDSYEEQRALCQQLTFSELQFAFDRRGVPFGKPQQRTLGFRMANGLFSNLAYILSDQWRQSAEIVWAEGVAPAGRMLYHASFRGSMAQVNYQLRARIEKLNLKRANRQKHAVPKPDFPDGAVEEALHRLFLLMDFSRPTPIRALLYDDRMELVGAGGVTKDYADLLRGETLCRNPRLSRVMERLYGVCTSLTLSRLQPMYYRAPELFGVECQAGYFRLVGPSQNIEKKKKPLCLYGERSSRALQLFIHRDTVTKAEAARALGMTEMQAAFLLNHMVRDGLLTILPSKAGYRVQKCVFLPTVTFSLPVELPCIPALDVKGLEARALRPPV